MKDFADIDNAVGTFPNVTAQDCTGPGETDGTAVVAETMTDRFGWIQALLTEAGDTPNDAVETSSASQILDDIKLLPVEYTISLSEGWEYEGATDWEFYEDYWTCNSNETFVYFPIFLPDVQMDLDIAVRVDPGGVETGTDRMAVVLQEKAQDGTYGDVGTRAYDDGTASLQTITKSYTSLTPDTAKAYRIGIKSQQGTNTDTVTFIKINKSRP
jgi:hypothetical protein